MITSPKQWPWRRWFLLGSSLLIVYLGLFSATDYGPMWDWWELYMGDKYLAFWTSWDMQLWAEHLVDLPIYSQPDHPNWFALLQSLQGNDIQTGSYMTFPLGPTLASVTKLIFYQWLGIYDAIAAQMLAPLFMVVALAVVLFRDTRRRAGLYAAILAVLICVFYPRFWAHTQNNIKDIPTAVMFAFSVLAFVRAIERRSAGRIWLAAVVWGLALATKANALFVPFVVAPFFVYVMARRWHHGQRLHGQDQRLLRPSEWIALLAFPFVGIASMIAAWPMLWYEFPKYLHLVIESIFERGLSEEPTGWNAEPLLNALVTIPLPIFFLLMVGLCTIAWDTWRRRRLSPWHLLLILWMVVPPLRASIPGAHDFDVIRHWLEFIPPLAIIAGLGGGRVLTFLIHWLRHSTLRESLYPWRHTIALLLILLWLSPVFHWNITRHPHQLVFYNSFVGGLGGAQQIGLPQATDYWASSYRQGYEWLNANAEPGSLVYVGVAEHLMWATREIWLDQGLIPATLVGVPDEVLRGQITHHPGSVYLMYVTRKPWYEPLASRADPVVPPVYTIEVDGGTILKILRLK